MKQKIKTLLTKLNKTLLYKYLFYKHFYKFIFLHKPLCPRYFQHTIKIFGMYVCRSCFLLYTGFIITLLLSVPAINEVKFNKLFYLGLSGAILTFIASYPPLYSHFTRISKDFVRFYDGVFIALGFVISFKININVGIASIITFIILRNKFNKKRGGERICKDCPELDKNTTCQGYLLQKQALLDIDEEYSSIIMNNLTKERKSV